VRAIVDWQQTTAAKTFPIYYTAGDFLPPSKPTGYRGQNWADGRNVTMNLGGLVSARLTDNWSLKAGVFRSTIDAPVSYADLYTDIQPNGHSDHVVVGFPDQFTGSTSGEARLTGAFGTGDLRQQVILMARGRETTARYGGQDAIDLGPADISVLVQTARPQFTYSPRTDDRAQLWSAGAAYRLAWRHVIEVETGVQQESYRETVVTPGTAASDVSAHPLRIYGNAALAIGHRLTLYGGYTQGLENSGTAPNSAANGGAVLPASKTWQVDAGVRYAVTPKFKIIAGVFELEKPYFNLDSNNFDRKLGVQKGKGVELSVAGEVAKGLTVNIGVLDGSVAITGPNLAAAGVGSVAVGQPRLIYDGNINYTLPWLPKVSLDASVLHFGAQPESVDDKIYTPATNQVNLGGRYRFAAFGHKTTLRVQVQNAIGPAVWTNVYTPGFFRYPGPRTVFAYLTTDFP
jgi:iron complex outermembrane recepter protein